jgi:Fur family ferric uptake transcriptional regulator
LQRPANYTTKHGKAILAYLAAEKELFVTAAQIAAHLQQAQGAISRPTIYRQLERLVAEGKIRKFSFSGISGSCFQYIDPNEGDQDCCHLKCEVCNGIFDLECDEVDHVARHIFEDHAFQVNGRKTVFYGRCKACLSE